MQLNLQHYIQWVWNIDGGFNWYMVAGGGLGSYSYDGNNNNSYVTFLFS
jgi:hypothetical protein